MSIKNHLNPHIQLNPNFNQIRNITTFLVIAFFAFQNVYEYFTGIGWFYAYLTSLSMFMLPTTATMPQSAMETSSSAGSAPAVGRQSCALAPL